MDLKSKSLLFSEWLSNIVYVGHMCVWCLQRPEERTWTLGTGVTDGLEPTDMNSGTKSRSSEGAAVVLCYFICLIYDGKYHISLLQNLIF